MGRLAVNTPALPVETEIKLALSPEHVRRLRRHPLLHAICPTRAKLHTVYFDTPDAVLLRHGVTLRLRHARRRWLQTLKACPGASGVLAQRAEWETPVTAARLQLDRLPPEAQACLPPDTGAALSPCFETVIRRETWDMVQEAARVEIALDRGEVRAGDLAWPISELELELKHGSAEALFDVAEALVTALPLGLEPRSKAQRGYQLIGALPLTPTKAMLPELDGGAPALKSFADIARNCLRQFEANLPGFRLAADPDPEYIHQMRVALRRLRAAVGLLRFTDYAPPDWVPDLKWLMGELSQARDWDVFVTETLPRIQRHLAQPERLAVLQPLAQQLRRVAHDRARRALDSPRPVQLWLRIERTLMTLPLTSLTTTAWLRTALHRRHRRLTRLGQRLQELDAAGRHALRIAAKKLRYGAEFFAGQRLKASNRFIRHLAALQDVLGGLNDAAVTARLLDDIRQVSDVTVGEALGLVSGFLAGEQAHRLAELERLWREFHRIEPFWSK
ncbi:CHAD domain-containing protein [Chloracidobacterium validum]|uniref:CHAD domain-containing protein n=1 Tax=Chloracidobacterium validum TaxID=2821543 RepID=A0ABX8BEP9_9BACT|nr:CYTH and CHAD domain-containing protein [Chloracidobacterium validum]QUW04375.1 CHAD domain-containing protein [Chloracidobacterium validum]